MKFRVVSLADTLDRILIYEGPKDGVVALSLPRKAAMQLAYALLSAANGQGADIEITRKNGIWEREWK